MNFNADLVDDLARRRVVLFLGSGVSASSLTRRNSRIRQWNDFLESAAESISNPDEQSTVKELIARNDLLLAAELLKEFLDDRWRGLLQEEFGQVAAASQLHRAILGLDQRLIITTNFDKLLENAWNDGSVEATHYPTVVTSLDPGVFRILRDDSSYIIKLHGTVDDEKGMIFTKSEYNEHAFGNWVYEDLLKTLLLTHTFLFVGFSMNDPAVSLLVEMYAHRFPRSRPHYIFLAGPLPPSLISVSKRLRRLYVMPYDPANGHAELVSHIERLGAESKIRAREHLAKAMARQENGTGISEPQT